MPVLLTFCFLAELEEKTCVQYIQSADVHNLTLFWSICDIDLIFNNNMDSPNYMEPDSFIFFHKQINFFGAN